MKSLPFFNSIVKNVQTISSTGGAFCSMPRYLHSSAATHQQFEGWALPAEYPVPPHTPSDFDHTFVFAPEQPARWKCHGRDGGEGQRRLSSSDGRGSFGKTKCIAGGATGDKEAAVVYGFTGVCHQIANRLLVDARISVLDARGARATSAYYGVYATLAGAGAGAAEWVARCRGCGVVNPFPVGVFDSNFSTYPDIMLKDMRTKEEASIYEKTDFDKDLPEGERKLLLHLDTLYRQTHLSSSQIHNLELELTLRHFLGAKISTTQTIELIKVRTSMLEEDKRMPQQLLKKFDASATDLYVALGQRIQSRYEAFARILGESTYGDYFEVEPARVKFAINPEVFYSVELQKFQEHSEQSSYKGSGCR